MHRRAAAATLLAALACVAAASPAGAGERILLDRERAEFTADFFAFTKGAPFGRDVHSNCRRRIALNVRRCRVSWEARGNAYKGRLLVAAFKERPDANRYRVRYRLRELDLACAAIRPESECTATSRGTDTYTGS